MLQHLTAMREEVLYVIFLDLHKEGLVQQFEAREYKYCNKIWPPGTNTGACLVDGYFIVREPCLGLSKYPTLRLKWVAPILQ